jgi:hypothetical protein
VSGVYRITCLITNKDYIGSSSRDIYRRLKDHRGFLRRGVHHSVLLQRAWNKYGASAFLFQIIEKCSAELCIEREQYWMDIFQCTNPRLGYNISPFAGSNRGSRFKRTHPPTPKSEQARRLVSLALRGVPKSREHALKVGAHHFNPIVQLTMDGKFIQEWQGASKVLPVLGIGQGNITNCCLRKRKSTGGFKWMYKSEYYGDTN